MVPPASHSSTPPNDHQPGVAAPSPAEDAFQQAIVELFEPAADVLGIPRSIAAIYAVIFASPRPLCFADVESRLPLSMGSVSQGLRVLREVGAIKLAHANGRREYFVPDMELRQLVARLLKNRIEPQLAGSSRRLAGLVESVPFADPAAAERVRGRLKHLQSWQRKARKFVPFVKTLLAVG